MEAKDIVRLSNIAFETLEKDDEVYFLDTDQAEKVWVPGKVTK